MRLLLIEDDRRLAQSVSRWLRSESFAVDVASDGVTGEEFAGTNDYDAIIMDIMLPRQDGWETLAHLRRGGNLTPIMMLTALGDVGDRIRGLDSGADDYLTKPFAFAELLARVRSLLRRGGSEKSTVLKIADLQLDVVTHKAKEHIRRWVKEEERKGIDDGREQWEKKAKKYKLHINEDELLKYVVAFSAASIREFFLKIHNGEIDPEVVVENIASKLKHPPQESIHEPKAVGWIEQFIRTARNISGGIVLGGTQEHLVHDYAKCCNPIPGDEIIGYVTSGEGIRVHRKSCKNVAVMAANEPQRIVDVSWPNTNGAEYAAAIRIAGEDRAGMLNDLAHSISSYQNTNIRGVNIDVKDALFDGFVFVNVKNTEHLDRIIERLRKIKGVIRAERLSE
jgi:CheY-like chemotaxis protein